jgi:hypothetical protein
MPVVECSCGMVMSVSVVQPRSSCIRCGSSDIRELHWPDPVSVVSKQSIDRLLTTNVARQKAGAGATQVDQHEVLTNRDYAI